METTNVRGRRYVRSILAAMVTQINGTMRGRLVCSTALTLTLAGSLSAQTIATGTISGRVIDSPTGKYLEGAEVSIAGSALHTTTTREGVFSLSGESPGEITLSVAYPGLMTKTVSATVAAGQFAVIEVKLGAEEVIQLETFNVAGEA